MRLNPQPPGYVGQPYTIEFTVLGDLDGFTLSPPIDVPSTNDDPQQIYRPNIVDSLGLIDVDYIVAAEGDGRLGAVGARIVQVVWINSPVVGGASAAIQVVDNVDGTPIVQRTIAPLVGLQTFYQDTPFLVPQGSMLRLLGFSNPSGSPIKVRLTIQYVEDGQSGIEVAGVTYHGALTGLGNNDHPQYLLTEDDVFINASLFGVVPSLLDAGPIITALLSAVSTGNPYVRRKVYIPPGNYTIATPVVHPANVVVWGAGGTTIFRQPVGASNTVWNFATGFLRSELAYCQVLGGVTNPADLTDRRGIGVDLAQTQQVHMHHMQIWDFLTGLRLSDGIAFSSYHDIGPHLEINRCTTGIYAPDEQNVSRIHDSRIFYSYGSLGEGVGFDIIDASALQIENVAIEATDLALRVRGSDGGLHVACNSNYYEPGTNPTTLEPGSCYDVLVEDIFDATSVFIDDNSIVSGSRGNIIMPPEAFCRADGYSRAFFGARFNGAAVPKRNLVFNGEILYYGLPSVLPNWAGGGVVPTVAQDQINYVTGNRSLLLTAPGATNSTLFAIFEVSDPGVQWVTCGIRYQVLAGNTGFFFTGTVGVNNRQLTDEIPGPGEWREKWVQVPVDPTNRTGSISINPDSVDGVGSVLVDEVWAVAGRYVIPSTQYAERVQMLPSPITIYSATGIVGLDLFGPIDITNLPALLAPPLDDFSTAPLGVIGGVFRLQVNMTGFPSTAVLGGPVYAFINIPASGAIVAATTHNVMATFGQTRHSGEVTIRDTTVAGGCVLYTGLATDYSVELIGWLLQ